MNNVVEQVAEWVAGARAVVFLTGAGMSTDSGIPDFRGPNGVWTKNPAAERTATIDQYVNDPEVRHAAWQSRLHSPMWDAQPNAGHRALAELETIASMHTLITQNIDGLHQKAGSAPEKVVEIHGSVREVVCLDCAWHAPMQVALDRVRDGEADPACPECGGILKSSTISFGQNLDVATLERAQDAALASDVFLALGTSLSVYPAAALPELAVRRNARLVIVNQQETPYDLRAHAVSHEPLGEFLPALVERVRGWLGQGVAPTTGPI